VYAGPASRPERNRDGSGGSGREYLAGESSRKFPRRGDARGNEETRDFPCAGRCAAADSVSSQRRESALVPLCNEYSKDYLRAPLIDKAAGALFRLALPRHPANYVAAVLSPFFLSFAAQNYLASLVAGA